MKLARETALRSSAIVIAKSAALKATGAIGDLAVSLAPTQLITGQRQLEAELPNANA